MTHRDRELYAEAQENAERRLWTHGLSWDSVDEEEWQMLVEQEKQKLEKAEKRQEP